LPAGKQDRRPAEPPETPEGDDTPTVSCTRCGREWELGYELDDLQIGNQAVEQFALDHKRHTGHFPDEVTPWIADCRQCPDGERFLSERSARRWARAHARHTRHSTELTHETLDEPSVLSPEDA
jgi:hypothetical protein